MRILWAQTQMICHSEKRILHIDLETYSSVDLASCGVYKYAESPDFRILLFGYAFDDGPVTVIEQPQELPEEICDALLNPDIIKVAHNAAFERVCLSYHLAKTTEGTDKNLCFLPPEQWQDTMIMASELGYPSSLAQLGSALNLAEDKQKMTVGKRLIQYFCKPCKPTLANGGRTRNMPTDDPEKWELFKSYNQRDVEAEQAIYNRLKALREVPESEWYNWHIDQRINDRGIRIDMKLVGSILNHNDRYTADLLDEMKELTHLDNPMSVAQLKGWIATQEPAVGVSSLNKATVAELLKSTQISPVTRRALEIRQELGKTSVKKYDAFKRAACKDERVHGCFQFYGGRTGRFAGRLIQPQNFPRNTFDEFDIARKFVREENWEAIDALFNSVNDVCSTLIRTAIIPADGYSFVTADYSAIEARVTAWLVREKWRQEAFKAGKDIYCASATQMFGVPVVKHGINGHLRQKGKIAELALGYGGGVGALKAMGGEAMGLTEDEMNDIVQKWRAASPHIKTFWSTLDKAFRSAINGSPKALDRGMAVYKKDGNVYIQLPNGRCIAYVSPWVDDQNQICFMGLNQTTRQWQEITTWGGKLTENVVQAIARDCLCEVLAKLENEGFRPVMHVHDEVICEVPYDKREAKLEELEAIMGQSPSWARDIVLTADGFYSDYYKKD